MYPTRRLRLRITLAGLVAVNATAVGCNPSASTLAIDDPIANVPASTPPSYFLLQYTGIYAASDTTFDSLVLTPDGYYVLALRGGAVERGAFRASPLAHALPLHVELQTFRATADVSIESAASLVLTRAGVEHRFAIITPIDTSGSRCTATGGAWDTAGPGLETGLQCSCPAATVYIPSRGGCVFLAAIPF
jgi:hypothetical protein